MTTTQNPPLPQPPFFSIPNINNFRDAALYPLTTSTGHSIRPNILFRSAEVSKLDLDGWRKVHDIGIAHVFDLRSKPEVDRGWAGIVGGDPNVRPEWIDAMEQAGIRRTWVPVFKEADYSPERLAERYVKYMDESVLGFVNAYREILKDGGDAYGVILRYLVNLPAPLSGDAAEKEEEKLGALVHCTAGKDRTGIFFGILFDFLGVQREKIAEEYHLTEQGLRHVREDVVARLMQSPGFKKYIAAQMAGTPLTTEDIAKGLRGGSGKGDYEDDGQVEIPPEVLEKGRHAALRMVGARKETMIKSLDMVDEEFGGAEKYMREYCKLTSEDLAALKKNLLVER